MSDTPIQFIYKLNSMEHAGAQITPAKFDYKGKREAVLAHVSELERSLATLTAERDRLREELAEADGMDGRCKIGHNRKFSYRLDGRDGCVACERESAERRATEAEAKLREVETWARDLLVYLDVEVESLPENEYKIYEEGYDKTIAGLAAALAPAQSGRGEGE